MTVSNLEANRTLSLYLTLTITRAGGNRELNNSNTQVVFDNGSNNNQPLTLNRLFSLNPNTTKYTTGAFSLRPGQTGLIAVLPNVLPFIRTTNPDLEIRGIVEIKQVRRVAFPFLSIAPEADIMTTPETRGTFLDNDYPTNSTANELDFDQIAYGLPNASGKAQNIVEKTFPFVIQPELVEDPVLELTVLQKKLRSDNPDITEEELDALSNSLVVLKDSNTDIKRLMRDINKKDSK